MSAIRFDLQRSGHLGLPEDIRCKGFLTEIDIKTGEIIAISLIYCFAVTGLDGTVLEVLTKPKRYTNEDKRTIPDGNGGIVTQPKIVDILDEEGNVIGQETIQEPVLIGVVEFLKQTIGDAYIIPDLQETINKIGNEILTIL
jgi:hypothetical protein